MKRPWVRKLLACAASLLVLNGGLLADQHSLWSGFCVIVGVLLLGWMTEPWIYEYRQIRNTVVIDAIREYERRNGPGSSVGIRR